ncbi:hypothetical protein [Amorphus sp. 3PC139-8]|uniref:hypothetical protein n=1 Tax=Amorphus sp. 3PC139-8 TaxID=2735676 RepID=UPI00345D823C
MDPNANPNTAATWQLFTMIAVAAAVFGVTIGLATAKPPPKLPACNADEGRRIVQAGFAAEHDDLVVFGLHSIREVSSIADGTELRRCTAIAITDQGERILRFIVGWVDRAEKIAFWGRPPMEQ